MTAIFFHRDASHVSNQLPRDTRHNPEAIRTVKRVQRCFGSTLDHALCSVHEPQWTSARSNYINASFLNDGRIQKLATRNECSVRRLESVVVPVYQAGLSKRS